MYEVSLRTEVLSKNYWSSTGKVLPEFRFVFVELVAVVGVRYLCSHNASPVFLNLHPPPDERNVVVARVPFHL